MAQKQKLEGQFIPLAISGPTVSGLPLSGSDLDEMVNNFPRQATKADHIPIRFGRAKSNGPVVAKISALQRDGDKLTGKLSDVDPRFEELYGVGKLGGRSSRSLAFERDDEKGKSLSEFGFMPPRIFHRGGWHDGPATDEALSDLLDAHREGDCVTYCASDAGRVELVFPEMPRAGRPTKRTAASSKSNGAELHELTLQYMEQHDIKQADYGNALTIVAREHPEFTVPDGVRRPVENPRNRLPQTNSVRLHELTASYMEQHSMKSAEYGDALTAVAREHPELTSDRTAAGGGEADNPLAGYRFQTNNERLTELAKERQEERSLSFAEALAEVVEDNPLLTLPDSTFGPLSPEAGISSFPLSNSQKLHKAAKELQRKKSLSYGEALTRAAQKHPELTLPD